MKEKFKIPKVIHYVWVGGKEKPSKIKNCIKTWEKKYPDFIIKEWNEKNFDINSNEYVKASYEAKKWAFVSDYIRMYAIYNEGGVYFDTDIIAIDRIDDMLDNECFVGFESDNMPFTAVFGAVKKHKLIGKILEMYDTASKKFDATATNTILVSDILINDYGCKLGNVEQMLDDGIKVYKKEILCNPSMKSRTIHAFTASWNKEHKVSLIGRFEIWLRGKMTNKFRIFFYRILDFLLFIPKRKIGKMLKRNGNENK